MTDSLKVADTPRRILQKEFLQGSISLESYRLLLGELLEIHYGAPVEVIR